MTEFDYSREFWEGLPRFVIIEGSDGAGKSTLVEGLVTWMRDVLQLDVEQLREPGSGAIAARIRELLLFATDENISTYEEILLMTTARVDTRLKHAQPALAAGKWVVCDRGELSSIVYQGFARDEGCMKFVKELQDQIQVIVRRADLYVILQISDKEALRRLGGTGKEPDRFEGAGDRFRTRVRKGFEMLGQLVPGEYRMAYVDAECSPEALVQRVIATIQDECM